MQWVILVQIFCGVSTSDTRSVVGAPRRPILEHVLNILRPNRAPSRRTIEQRQINLRQIRVAQDIALEVPHPKRRLLLDVRQQMNDPTLTELARGRFIPDHDMLTRLVDPRVSGQGARRKSPQLGVVNLQRPTDLLEMVGARDLVGRFAGSQDGRNQYRNQGGDYDDNHQ